MSEFKESIGGIWVRQSKSGNEYFSISLEGKNYVAFGNKYKSGNQPDYRIFPAEDRPKVPVKQEPMPDDDSSDVPF